MSTILNILFEVKNRKPHCLGPEGCSLPQTRLIWTELGKQILVFSLLFSHCFLLLTCDYYCFIHFVLVAWLSLAPHIKFVIGVIFIEFTTVSNKHYIVTQTLNCKPPLERWNHICQRQLWIFNSWHNCGFLFPLLQIRDDNGDDITQYSIGTKYITKTLS